MITTKERAKLRGYANSLDTILQIGKEGVTPAVIKQIQDAIEAREMIKIRVLDNLMLSARDISAQILEQCDFDVVQVIGTKIVLYKKKKKDPIYEL